MSWVVESLLINRYKIKESIEKSLGYRYNSHLDSYDDLIDIESEIDRLLSEGIIDELELKILDAVINSESYRVASNDLDMEKSTVAKRFHEICDKIAFYLGSRFTDIGYIRYLKKKYNLTDNQVERMVLYMKSEYKHRLVGKSFKGEESD